MYRPREEIDITGVENEYSIGVWHKGRAVPDFFSPAHAHIFFHQCIGEPLVSQHLLFERPAHLFLLTGDRAYMDQYHIELATRESSSPRSQVIHENACDQIVEKGVERANEIWGPEGYRFRMYKNNLDFQGNTWSSHESYMVRSSQLDFGEEFVSTFAPFYITTPLFAGNGKVQVERGKFVFYLSQRMQKAETAASGGTTSSRAIINTRDEPQADGSRFRRRHLILKDSLLFQTAQFLACSTKLMVLKTIAAGYFSLPPYGIISGENLVSACKAFARYSALRKPVDLNGHSVTVIDVQELFRDVTRRYYEEERDMTPDDQLTFTLWDTIIERAKTPRPYEGLSPYVDWAGMLLFIEQDMALRSYSWDTPNTSITRKAVGTETKVSRVERADTHLQEIDILFHEKSPRGIATWLMNRQDSEVLRIVSDEEIAAATKGPVFFDTRAYARHLEMKLAIQEALRRDKKLAVKQPHQLEWVRSQYVDGKEIVFDFEDLDPTDPLPNPKQDSHEIIEDSA